MKRIFLVICLSALILVACQAETKNITLEAEAVFDNNQHLEQLFGNQNSKITFSGMGDNYTFSLDVDLYEQGELVESLLAVDYLTLDDKTIETMYNLENDILRLTVNLEQRIGKDIVEHIMLNESTKYLGISGSYEILHNEKINLGVYYESSEELKNESVESIVNNADKAILIHCTILEGVKK